MKLYLNLLLLTVLSATHAVEPIDLSGEWRFALDPQDLGIHQTPDNWNFPDRIRLPGKLTEQGFGNEPSFETRWTGGSWRHPDMFVEWQKPGNFKYPFTLQPPRHYLGAAWYEREIIIPESWDGLDVRVMLERPHWETTLWIDGRKVGGMNSLGTPHRYDLGPLSPGEHTLTLRIDNRQDDVDVGGAAHSITDETQGNWNGVVGAMELQPLAPDRIDRVDVHPSLDGTIKLVIEGRNAAALDLQISCTPVGETTAPPFLTSPIDSPGRFKKTVEAKVPFKPVPWSEFSPTLYDLTISLGGGRPPFTTRFGFREIENRDGILTLNGGRLFLRGTLDCAIFPRLGHPPTDIEPWKRIIRTCQAHGLNHIRFHSWCPPKAAFTAADELGFYFQVEASAWARTVGDGGPFDAWLEVETELMRAEYGNHACFILMAYGNEPHGENHVRHLTDWVIRQAKTDARRIHTTGAGWPVVKGSGFHNPPVRIQAWGAGLNSVINARAPNTSFDFANYVKQHRDAPVVSHEIGQWCAYPNFREIDKYEGFFKARNFEIFRETAKRNGLLEQADEFLWASGRWQAACYKHDIEAALRTPDFGGFQLLSLSDFSGQGTALVGVLDAFWEEKGYISPGEFRRFCAPSVPLARMERMVFTRDESLSAKIELAHFGAHDLKQSRTTWTLTADEKPVASGEFPARDFSRGELHEIGAIKVPLSSAPAPAQLKFSVSVEGVESINSWDLFVYPPEVPEPPDGFVTTDSLDHALTALKSGEKVLWLADPNEVADDPRHPLQIGFSTIFWNTAYTDWQPPHTLGLLNRPNHPALSKFPTEEHTNWQYWELVTRSRPFILTPHHELRPVIQPIDDWFTNRKLALVFEAKVGKGKLLACSIDLKNDLATRPAARQLRHSLQSYAASNHFQPTTTLTKADLEVLVDPPSLVRELGATIRASSADKGYGPELAIDGDPTTFWHSRFTGNTAKPPHEITLTFPRTVELTHVRVFQRTDGSANGRLSELVVLDDQGKEIARIEVARHADRITLPLPNSTWTSRLTVRLPTVGNRVHAAIAEIEVLGPEATAPPGTQRDRPNVLWITLEDTSPHFIGCYGNPAARTPNIDRLASRGIRFDRAFANAPVCSSARSTIITGTLNETLGTGHHRSAFPLPRHIQGFPTRLRASGYHTSNNRKTDYATSSEARLVSESWNECSSNAGWWNRRSDQPFFSIFNIEDCHQSRTMTWSHDWYRRNIYETLETAHQVADDAFELPPFLPDTRGVRRSFARIYNSIARADEKVGEILDRLETDGLTDDTIIFCYADHGEAMPRGKANPIGLGYRVPFIITFPPKWQHLNPWGKPGGSSDELICFDDLGPTMLSLIDTPPEPWMTGRPFLGARRAPTRPYIFCSRNRIDEGTACARSITDGRFLYTRHFLPAPEFPQLNYFEVADLSRLLRKAHAEGMLDETQGRMFEPGRHEVLYDLDSDPWEICDLSEDPAHAERLATLRDTLFQHMVEVRDVMLRPEYELAQISASSTPFEAGAAASPEQLREILHAADLASRQETRPEIPALLEHDSPVIRYWATTALRRSSEYSRDKVDYESLDYPPAEIEMAAARFQHDGDAEAASVLKHHALSDDPHLQLHALQRIQGFGAEAEAFEETLRKAARHANYNTRCSAQVTLYLLGKGSISYPDPKW